MKGQMNLFPIDEVDEISGIEHLIPFGKKNAVTREYLSSITGLSDRMVRREIEKAKKTHPILNLQDGNGYFRPTITEYLEAKQYYNQERHRAVKILFNLGGLKKWLRDVSG